MELFRRKTISEYLSALAHENPAVRRHAVRALGKAADVQAITPLLHRLPQETDAIRNQVMQALNRLCPYVQTVIFGHPLGTVTPSHTTLYSPDVSLLTIPLERLERVIVNMAHCDVVGLSHFAAYFHAHIPRDYVQESVTLHLSGPLGAYPLSLYNVFSPCRQVTTYLQRVCFGQAHDPRSFLGTTVWNGDFSSCTLPFRKIRYIIIDASTYDPYLLECFLTYAMNILGGQHLRRAVTASIHGDPGNVDINLRNSLTNLCAHVTMLSPEEGELFRPE